MIAGREFAIQIGGVKNAPSLKPTSPFTNMKFSGRYGNDRYDIADYKPSTPLRVKNDIVGIIQNLKIE